MDIRRSIAAPWGILGLLLVTSFLAAMDSKDPAWAYLDAPSADNPHPGMNESGTTWEDRRFLVAGEDQGVLAGKIEAAIAAAKSPEQVKKDLDQYGVRKGWESRGGDLPAPLAGSEFAAIPPGSQYLRSGLLRATAAGRVSLRIVSWGRASVSLNGRRVWSQEAGKAPIDAGLVLLDLDQGPNQVVINSGPTPVFAILTTRTAQRVGAFLAPLFAADPVAFAWFDPWLERLSVAPQGDPLIALLRDVGTQAVAELHQRGDATAALPEASSLGELTRTVLRLGARRRALRLTELRSQAPVIAYAVHRDYAQVSFFAYTEGLSDARAERHFHPGSALRLVDLSAGEPVQRTLIDDPRGMIRDPDVSHDGQSLLFAWKKSDRNDDFQLYEMDLGTQAVRQLTHDLGTANLEGAYLPDGGIVFASTRGEHSVPCWRTEVTNLYKMDRDGTFIRRLGIDQVHTLYPKPTDDGRITYTRWDYSDRGQVFPHPLFQMNQDGTGQAALYGASSWFPTSKLHARQIPGTTRFLAIAAGHHTPQSGKVIEIDPAEGRDEGKGVRFLAPPGDHPYERTDRAMQSGALFAHPHPLANQTFLAAHLPASRLVRRFDLYWFTYDGGRELLAADEGQLSSLYPVPVRVRPRGHLRPDLVDHARQDAVIYLGDVYQGPGLAGIPRGTADRLRVVEVRYRSATVGPGVRNQGPGGASDNGTPIAIAQGSWDVKAIIGDTPIRADGSVLVRIPALKSVYYQILDRQGQVIQTMRTWDNHQPGEVKSCTGCHASPNSAAPSVPSGGTTAWANQGPASLTPFKATGWEGFSFPRHVQPILDRNCLSCHQGKDPGRIDLRGDVIDLEPSIGRAWSRAYTQLTGSVLRPDGHYSGNPDGPWVKWINKMSEPTPLTPYGTGSAKSPLIKLLRDGHHGVTLTKDDSETLAAWIDLLVPFAGEYHEATTWNEKQRGYYDYYEDKRRLNKQAEAADLGRHLAGTDRTAWLQAEMPQVRVSLAGKASFTADVAPGQLAAGPVTLILPGLHPGDTLTFTGAPRLRITVGSLAEAEVVLPGNTFTWTADPGLARALPPALLDGSPLSVRIAGVRDAQRGDYRNLARNPLAPILAPGATPPVFPCATATSETRGDPVFRARNAIDGQTINGKHGGFPHQSWGPDREAKDPGFTVAFGRKVRIDRVDLFLRADFPHDQAWARGELWADGTKIANLHLSASAAVQTTSFPPVECATVELRNLVPGKPGWCALSEIQVWGLDADRTPANRILAAKSAGLAQVPLQ